MSSDSDSEDDYYGKVSQRFQSMKSKFNAEIETSDATPNINDNSWRKNFLNDSQNSIERDAISLDQIIADNSKKKPKKRAVAETVNNECKRRKNSIKPEAGPSGLSQATDSTTKRGRGRGRGKQAASKRGQRRTRNNSSFELTPAEITALGELMNESIIDSMAKSAVQNNLPALVPDQYVPTSSKIMVPCHVCGSSNPGLPIEVRDSMVKANLTNGIASTNVVTNGGNSDTNAVTKLVNTISNADAHIQTAINIPSNTANITDSSTNVADVINTATTPSKDYNSKTLTSRTARGKGRGKKSAVTSNTANTNTGLDNNAASTSTSGRRGSTTRSRGRGRKSTPRCTRQRGRNRRAPTSPTLDILQAMANSLAYTDYGGGPNRTNNIPVYSVGNTDEYPDQSDDQPLFTAPQKPSDTKVLEENDPELDNNEEMSVKVYWQSSDHVKFNIRRYQKITQIFDYFAEREKVSKDKLFFTYNDKVLKSDHTPDSIGYSIAKFIDGGIIEQSVSSIFKNTDKEEEQGGIKLKFQCKNMKKPFVASLKADDRMHVVMVKCAEHLEMPIEKLKFHFDGDLISGKSTPMDLELEGGECIDVTLSS